MNLKDSCKDIWDLRGGHDFVEIKVKGNIIGDESLYSDSIISQVRTIKLSRIIEFNYNKKEIT